MLLSFDKMKATALSIIVYTKKKLDRCKKKKNIM